MLIIDTIGDRRSVNCINFNEENTITTRDYHRAATTLTKSARSIAMTTISTTERSFTCSDGIKLAVKCWSNGGSNKTEPTKKILCLHGWLDNAASFNRLAPLLLDSLSPLSDEQQQQPPMEIMALDFPGHGLSGHKSVDGPPQLLAEAAYYVLECIEALAWGKGDDSGSGGGTPRTVVGNINANVNNTNNSSQRNNGGDKSNDDNNDESTNNNERDNKINLIGHSMGAGVSVVLVAAFPELFASVTLLEGAGPLARNAKDCSKHVRAACQRRLKSNKTLFPGGTNGVNAADGTNTMTARARVYRNIDAAIEARLDTTRRMPGGQYLSVEAVRDMVMRATVEATVAAAATSNSSEDDTNRPVKFRHDPRLQWPSLQYYTREQVEAFYSDVCDSNVPVSILMAEDGWPVDSWSQSAVNDILKPCQMKLLKGSHHFHADPDTVGDVAAEIVSFLKA
jgi:pimeloyl-ACP methyl ester carboxylesterase